MTGFQSTTLGRSVTADDINALDDHAVVTALWLEVGEKLSDTNAQLQRFPRHLNQPADPEHQSLLRLRAFLAPFHQRLARRKAQLRNDVVLSSPSALRGESPHSDAIASVPSVEGFYLNVARQELDPATHQRLLLIAEQRRNSAIQQSTGLAMGR